MDSKDNTDKTEKKLRNLKPFKSGKDWNGNALGRPKGSVSPITKVKQIFEQNPEFFQEWLLEYIKDPSNRKHIVEMIDGRPKGDSPTLNVEKLEKLTIVLDNDN